MVIIPPGAADQAQARRSLVGQLKEAKAVSLDRAVPLEVSGRSEERMLARLLRQEIIRRGPKGGFWLDQERYGDSCRRQMIFVIGFLLVAIGVTACLAIYGK